MCLNRNCFIKRKAKIYLTLLYCLVTLPFTVNQVVITRCSLVVNRLVLAMNNIRMH